MYYIIGYVAPRKNIEKSFTVPELCPEIWSLNILTDQDWFAAGQVSSLWTFSLIFCTELCQFWGSRGSQFSMDIFPYFLNRVMTFFTSAAKVFSYGDFPLFCAPSYVIFIPARDKKLNNAQGSSPVHFGKPNESDAQIQNMYTFFEFFKILRGSAKYAKHIWITDHRIWLNSAVSRRRRERGLPAWVRSFTPTANSGAAIIFFIFIWYDMICLCGAVDIPFV